MSAGRFSTSPRGIFFAFALSTGTLLFALPNVRAESPGLNTSLLGNRSADWSGPYLGVNASAGALFGNYSFDRVFTDTATPPPGLSTGFLGDARDTSFVAGVYAGRSWQFDHLVFGLEGHLDAVSLRRFINRETLASPGLATEANLIRVRNSWAGTVLGRGGYAFDRYLVYFMAGGTLANASVTTTDGMSLPGFAGLSAGKRLLGYTGGGGFEAALARWWSMGIDYRYSQFTGNNITSAGHPAPGPALPHLDLTTHQVTARLSWHSAGLRMPSESYSDDLQRPQSGNWNFHGQSTLFEQGVNAFRSPYVGTNSLIPAQARETWTNTLFIGTKLWDGAEAYFNPEFNQGFGLSQTLGLGGFSNGEAQKAGTLFPKFRAQRYFLRQTIGLGGDEEAVSDAPNQIAGKRDVDRITVTAGRFAVGDFFDDNAYAHDPRANFMNWAIWSSAAYDFPADLPGFTHGVVVELNRKDWAVRGGYFQVPKEPNSDVLTFNTGGVIVELEERYRLFEQPGKLRAGMFSNRGATGNYREALALVAINPNLDINDVMISTRRNRSKTGFYVNAEQAVAKDVGVFGRFSWNDGRNEILSFTDIDRSISAGISVKGAGWGRPKDTFGLAGAVNGLSDAHRNYLAAGGLGLLIGDGALNYRPETILETYYSANLAQAIRLSLDYQFIVHPAYNVDRGPASFLGARIHAEF